MVRRIGAVVLAVNPNGSLIHHNLQLLGTGIVSAEQVIGHLCIEGHFHLVVGTAVSHVVSDVVGVCLKIDGGQTEVARIDGQRRVGLLEHSGLQV